MSLLQISFWVRGFYKPERKHEREFKPWEFHLTFWEGMWTIGEPGRSLSCLEKYRYPDITLCRNISLQVFVVGNLGLHSEFCVYGKGLTGQEHFSSVRIRGHFPKECFWNRYAQRYNGRLKDWTPTTTCFVIDSLLLKELRALPKAYLPPK